MFECVILVGPKSANRKNSLLKNLNKNSSKIHKISILQEVSYASSSIKWESDSKRGSSRVDMHALQFGMLHHFVAIKLTYLCTFIHKSSVTVTWHSFWTITNNCVHVVIYISHNNEESNNNNNRVVSYTNKERKLFVVSRVNN